MALVFARRRRHTIFKCDWSSDVCSSDLYTATSGTLTFSPGQTVKNIPVDITDDTTPEIGRASCRERVKISVAAVSLIKKQQTITHTTNHPATCSYPYIPYSSPSHVVILR